MAWGIRFWSEWGLSARAIARKKFRCRCRVKDGCCSHMAMVYRVTRSAGIRMYDYRDGFNDNSALTFKQVRKRKKAS